MGRGGSGGSEKHPMPSKATPNGMARRPGMERLVVLTWSDVGCQVVGG
jgi:hypothetical protein